jgi:hypothetical protein
MQSTLPIQANQTTMNRTKEIVQGLLGKHPATRDNDNLLCSLIWRQESNLFNFFSRLESGKLTSPETIRRCRQKLQRDNPNLRGALYDLRQNRQRKVLKDLGYNV